MAIQKQEFYEGAALHILARAGGINQVRYEAPFFVLNQTLPVMLKYSTRGRSPWAFTFDDDERDILKLKASEGRLIIGLICGRDGVAAFTYDSFKTIASPDPGAFHVACHRKHGKHYEVAGPIGSLQEKIALANWRRILNQ
jgi:hypothetical protein